MAVVKKDESLRHYAHFGVQKRMAVEAGVVEVRSVVDLEEEEEAGAAAAVEDVVGVSGWGEEGVMGCTDTEDDVVARDCNDPLNERAVVDDDAEMSADIHKPVYAAAGVDMDMSVDVDADANAAHFEKVDDNDGTA